MQSPSHYEAFAVAAPGLEPIVQLELRALGAARTQAVEGGVGFKASTELLYRANLHLRAASRVIVRVASFHAASFAELERRARRIAWETMVPRRGRVRLRVTCRKSRLYHSDAVAERLLGAIAERTEASRKEETRDHAALPDVDAADAQLFIVRLEHNECTISIDSSGSHLHQRGYRRAVTQAPLRETLAAAMLLASGWDQSTPLVDPFCGSGTIPIEAALIARNIAPGRHRSFRFAAWPSFDAGLWNTVLERAAEAERPAATVPIRGFDRSGWAMRAAHGNAERAGVVADVEFAREDATTLATSPGPAGWVVTNPPYGVRLGERDELRQLYSRFGAVLRSGFRRWHVGILSTDRRLDHQVGLPLLDKLQTTNGGIRVHLLVGIVPDGRRGGNAEG